MGLADRDWYQDELARRQRGESRGNPGPRPNGSDRARSVPSGGLVAVVLIFLIGGLGSHWLHSRQAEAASQSTSPKPGQATSRTSVPAAYESVPIAAPAPRVMTPAPTTVTKCVVNGKVTYSESASCLGDAWAVTTNNDGGASSELQLTEYQRDMLRSADQRIAREHAAAIANDQMARPSGGEGRCAGIDGEIAAIDAQARSPHSGAAQDSLRSWRTELMSRKFALRC